MPPAIPHPRERTHSRQAIDLIVRHIERYRSSLFGHIIDLPGHDNNEFRLVDRTNNRIEGLLHLAKGPHNNNSSKFEHASPSYYPSPLVQMQIGNVDFDELFSSAH